MPAQLPAKGPSHTSNIGWLAGLSPSSPLCDAALLGPHLCSMMAALLITNRRAPQRLGMLRIKCTIQALLPCPVQLLGHELWQHVLQSSCHILQGDWSESAHMQRSRAASPYSSLSGRPDDFLPVSNIKSTCHGQAAAAGLSQMIMMHGRLQEELAVILACDPGHALD